MSVPVRIWNMSLIEGNKVIVPEGQKVTGDLTVVNGDVQVLGDLDGNLTVIDGNVDPLASTAHIAGEIKDNRPCGRLVLVQSQLILRNVDLRFLIKLEFDSI